MIHAFSRHFQGSKRRVALIMKRGKRIRNAHCQQEGSKKSWIHHGDGNDLNAILDLRFSSGASSKDFFDTLQLDDVTVVSFPQ